MTKIFSLLQVQGPDAQKFLQGQVTCDVVQLTTSRGSYAAHCTPKGRVLFNFFIVRRTEDCFWLQLLSSQAEQAIKDLKKYAVFFKLQITDITDQFPLQLITTNSANANLATNIQLDIQQDEKGFIRQRHPDYWEIAGASPINIQDTKPADNGLWQRLDIFQGIAHVQPETRELFTPEDLNYSLIDAVSFRKGCYTGQEIVARMHYKGKHKRHTHRFLLNSLASPIVGSTVFSLQTGQKIGELVSAIANENQWDCLCSIQDAEKDNTCIGENQEKMQWASLPYAIPVAED